MPACSAYGCSNRTGRKPKSQIDFEQTAKTKIHFFKFPKDPIKRFLWEKAVRRLGWTPSEASSICSDHFEESLIDRTMTIVRLKEDAIPTIFPAFPKHLQEKTRKMFFKEEEKKPAVKLETSESMNKTLPQDSQDQKPLMKLVQPVGNSYNSISTNASSSTLKVIPIPKEAVNSIQIGNENAQNAPLKIIQLPRHCVDFSELKMECPPLRVVKCSKSTMTGPELVPPEVRKMRAALKKITEKYQLKIKTLQQRLRRKEKTIERLNETIESLKTKEKLLIMYDRD